MIAVSLPARINVVGSPSDAAEGAYATISAAVEPRGGADIGPDTGLTLRRGDGAAARFDAVPIVEHRGFAVEAAAVNALCRAVPDLPARIAARGAAIRTWTDIPASSGLGGSSVLLLAVLAALRAYYALDPRRWNDYVLAELAQRAEEHDLGVACGYADRYAPLFGDVAYVWRHLPLSDVHPDAQLAAEAAEAAADQGAFWPMHDLLLANQDALRADDLLGYAERLGLDVDRFTSDLFAHVGAARVAEDIDSADLSGVSGTPTFFVNGRRHYGAYDIETLSAAVHAAGARATLSAAPVD